jgi:hypothetical protein
MRFVRIATIVTVLAAIIVPTALALGFTDSDFPLPDATQGVPYNFQLNGTKGCPPYTYTVTSGALPPGINLSSGGLLSGSATSPGTWGFYLDLADSCGFHAQRPFSLTVIPKLTVTTDTLASGVVGVPYSVQLAFTGGGSVGWSVTAGTLPAGLTLSNAGLLSGTPTTAGTSTFTVFAKDVNSSRSDTKQLTLEILAPLTATVGSAPAAEVGIAFKGITPAATGGKPPYVWSVTGGSLPSGLALDPATGAITGTPAAAGSFPLKLGVADANNSTVAIDVPITVAAKLTVTTLRIPATKVGALFQATVRTQGGIAPIKWKVTAGKFPVGIKLDTKTGIISGTPRTAGVFAFKVTVTDKLGGTFEQSLNLLVKPKPKIKKK